MQSLRKLPTTQRNTVLAILGRLPLTGTAVALTLLVPTICCPPIDADDSLYDDYSFDTNPLATAVAPESAEAQPESADTESRKISDIRPSLDYAWGNVDMETLPENFAVNTDDEPMERVIGSPLLLQWQASNIWYHPLYFEDAPLERYGHTYDNHIQYVLSPVKFVGDAAMLPYKSTLRPHGSREYPLGWYRPGECAPHLKYLPPWNGEAAVHQALAVTGLFFLIP